MIYRLLTVILVALIAFTGCSSKNKSGKDGADGGLSESDLNAQREGRFGEGGIPLAEGEGLFRDVPFDYDSASLTDEGRQSVEYNHQVLESDPSLKIQLEGHCDDRGTAEYNLALGERRARAVYDMLMTLGTPAGRLETISYGEEVPLAQGQDESSFARNRRVHFSGYNANRNG